MTEPSAQLQDRRGLLRDIIRYAALIGLGVIGGAAVRRRRALRDGDCLNRGICRGCEALDDCGLPQAVSARQALKEKR